MALLNDSMEGFYGTEAYHRWSPQLYPTHLLTDGAKYAAETYKAFWLMDAIASYAKKLRNEPFQVWKLRKLPEGGAVLTCEDGNYRPLTSQKIEFTDIPGDIDIWVGQSGEYWVLHLPSES
jgi:hypothetical protein